MTQPLADVYRLWWNALPAVRGKGLLLRMIPTLNRVGFLPPLVKGEDGVVVEFGNDCITGQLLVSGHFEPDHTEVMRQHTSGGDVWIDVGANVGYYALLASRWVGPLGKIYAFEPVPRTLERLRRNLALNGTTNVRVLPFAVGAAPGTAHMIFEQDPGLSHVVGTGGQEVQVTTLDDFAEQEGLERLDFLKIDVEGFDYAVLCGARRTIERFRPVILTEVRAEPDAPNYVGLVTALLEPLGYDYRLYSNPGSYDLLATIPDNVRQNERST